MEKTQAYLDKLFYIEKQKQKKYFFVEEKTMKENGTWFL